MAEKLTPQQQMVIDNRGGKLLVSAAAGSGKTKVLVDRLMKYIRDENDPANIDDFLLITFTEAAASELRGKIAAKLSEHIAADPTDRHLQRQMQRLYMTKISTVHSFCCDLLREFAYLLDIPGGFRLCDENECIQLKTLALETVMDNAYERIHEDSDFQAVVDTQGVGRKDDSLSKVINKVLDLSNCFIDPDGWLQKCIDDADVSGITDAAETIWGKSLIEDLRLFLKEEISSFQHCASVLEKFPNQEKGVAVILDNAALLQKLHDCQTWDEIISMKSLDFGSLNFKYKYIDKDTAEYIKAVRSRCKEIVIEKLSRFYDFSDQVLADLRTCSPSARGLVQIVREFNCEYSRLKRARRLLDFVDLEQFALTLLLGKNRNSPTAASKEIAKRFREIMVDEYQDTNAVQDAIFSVLSNDRNNLFMVGDIKQSIYQFRLADPGIFLRKYAEYAPAEVAKEGEGRKICLSSNFRSGGAILKGVNDVFVRCMNKQVGGLIYGKDEALNEGISHVPLGEPEVELHGIIPAQVAYDDEAAFVAERICQLIDGKTMVRDKDQLRPICLNDIVILLRSPSTSGSHFIEALEARGIPYKCEGGFDLLRMPEIEVLHSLLKVISNPRQDIPLVSVMLSPVGGFTADDLACVRSSNRDCNLYDVLCDSKLDKCISFVSMLSSLRKTASLSTIPELLSVIINMTRIDALYSAKGYGRNAKDNLLEFYQYAAGYSGLNGRNLDDFLHHLEILQQKGLSVNNDTGDGVTIMTIHKSKGLEFPVVFVSALAKSFSKKDLEPPVLCHKDLGFGFTCLDLSNRTRYRSLSKYAIESRLISDLVSEELRILYVAMTRACDRLIMTYSDRHLRSTLSKLSLKSVYSSPVLLSSDVKSAGEWVLLTALHRTEAGTFFELAGNNGRASVSEFPWKITVHTCVVADEEEGEVLFADMPEPEPAPTNRIRQLMNFKYPYFAATTAPSKQTATQIKGREIDQEVSKDAESVPATHRVWRDVSIRPSTNSGKEFGNAVHSVLRFINFSQCSSVENIAAELERLKKEEYISPEHASLIRPGMVYAFFSSEIGKKLVSAETVLREFKFSLLDEGSKYSDTLTGDKILIQGVVDCALVEEDGLTIIDFKTDYVTDETVDSLVQQYTPQVETYASALSRIYELPVKGKTLYFFKLNRFCWL